MVLGMLLALQTFSVLLVIPCDWVVQSWIVCWIGRTQPPAEAAQIFLLGGNAYFSSPTHFLGFCSVCLLPMLQDALFLALGFIVPFVHWVAR